MKIIEMCPCGEEPTERIICEKVSKDDSRLLLSYLNDRESIMRYFAVTDDYVLYSGGYYTVTKPKN